MVGDELFYNYAHVYTVHIGPTWLIVFMVSWSLVHFLMQKTSHKRIKLMYASCYFNKYTVRYAMSLYHDI